MDDFRKEQKKDCSDYSKHKFKYGCPCCRHFNVSLNKFKKLSRKGAKNRLRIATKKMLQNTESA